jgi:hypothetical protein
MLGARRIFAGVGGSPGGVYAPRQAAELARHRGLDPSRASLPGQTT